MKDIKELVEKTAKKNNIILTDEKMSEAVNMVEYWNNVFKEKAFNLSDLEKWNMLKFKLHTAAKQEWDFSFNFQTIKNLFHYFNDSDQTTLDRDRGLLIKGNYGTGKTTIIRSLFEVPFKPITKEAFIFGKTKRISCLNVVLECSKEEEAVYKYIKDDWLFDDLGREGRTLYSKADSNPLFSFIIESRYASDIPLKTYYTTNLSIEDLKKKYTSRIESILYETCNIIDMIGDDFRKK